MSTDITRTTEVQPQSASVSERRVPLQSIQSAQEQPGQKLALPEKTRLQFDPNEMQKNLQDAIERLNDQMKRNGRNLNFSIDKVIDRTVIQVKNSETGELVRQIPDETMLRVAHNIEAVKGLLLDNSL